MKTRIITLITLLFLSFAGNAQIDRSKQPKPGPSPKIKLGKAETFTLKNDERNFNHVRVKTHLR